MLPVCAYLVRPELPLCVCLCDASVKLSRPLSAFEKVSLSAHGGHRSCAQSRTGPAAAAAAAVLLLTLPSSLPDHHF